MNQLNFMEAEQRPKRATGNITMTDKAVSVVFELVRYRTDDGYFVAMATLAGEQITIVGTSEFVPGPGTKCTIMGEWTNHPRYGSQFKVSHFVFEDDADAIRSMLASGFLKHVKSAMAERIAEAFGPQTFAVLDRCAEANDTAELQRVNGVGRVTGPAIINSWKGQREWAHSALLCIKAGLSMTLARKAKKLFENLLAKIILESPYRLTHVRGITFQEADRIAKLEWDGKAAIDHDDPQRYAAGIRHVLEEAHGHGHMCYPLAETLTKAAEFIQPNLPMWERVEPTADDEGLVLSGDDLYLKEMFEKEVVLAGTIKALAAAPDNEAIKRAILSLAGMDPKRYSQVDLTNEQIEAVWKALCYKVSIITGGPGVGKTATLQALANVVDSCRLSMVLCAPTGKAARRMQEATGFEASTIHRALKIRSEDLVGGTFAGVDFIIIDEVSMLDCSLAVNVVKGMSNGSHLVLIGDDDQLPSVGAGEVLHQLIAAGLPTTKLTKIHRQAEGSGIIKAAHEINAGHEPVTSGNDFEVVVAGGNAMIPHELNRHLANALKNGTRFEDVQILSPVNKNAWGQLAINHMIQQMYNPGQPPLPGVPFKVEDRVIHTKNNYDLGVLNGMVGQVVSVMSGEEEKAYISMAKERGLEDGDGNLDLPIVVRVRYDDQVVGYKRADLVELQLAYCITIHKSQGSEFTVVILLCPQVYEPFMLRQLLYTGITRGKQHVILIQSPGAAAKCAANEERLRRYSNLAGMLKGAE